MNKKQYFALFLVIILATFSRLFINIPNFSAIGALALFCGATLSRQRFSVLIPFIALLAGDLAMAATGKMYSDYFRDGYFVYVYIGFALTWLIGKSLLTRNDYKKLIAASLVSSLLFFLITNFGAWLQISYYPKTLSGLGQAYLSGLVFYKQDLLSNFFLNQVAGDLIFNLGLFGFYRYLTSASANEVSRKAAA